MHMHQNSHTIGIPPSITNTNPTNDSSTNHLQLNGADALTRPPFTNHQIEYPYAKQQAFTPISSLSSSHNSSFSTATPTVTATTTTTAPPTVSGFRSPTSTAITVNSNGFYSSHSYENNGVLLKTEIADNSIGTVGGDIPSNYFTNEHTPAHTTRNIGYNSSNTTVTTNNTTNTTTTYTIDTGSNDNSEDIAAITGSNTNRDCASSSNSSGSNSDSSIGVDNSQVEEPVLSEIDQTLLHNLNTKLPLISDGLCSYLMNRTGSNTTDQNVVRLVSVIAQISLEKIIDEVRHSEEASLNTTDPQLHAKQSTTLDAQNLCNALAAHDEDYVGPNIDNFVFQH